MMKIFQKLCGNGIATYCKISKLLFNSSRYRYFTQQETNQKADVRMDGVYRQKDCYKAVVKKVKDASPGIKILQLQIEQPGFSFKAGQWVDFFVPGIEEIGGYSITSAPYEAEENGTLELAIKFGDFPPTRYVHSTCKAGDTIEIKVGGDFFYEPDSSNSPEDLLLIGGGMGINPMVSILSQYYYLLDRKTKSDSSLNPSTVILLYSAKTDKEMIFRAKFEELKATHLNLICQYFITQRNLSLDPSTVKNQRIQQTNIEQSISKLRKNNLLCYVCGPSIMTDETTIILQKQGIDNSCIKYEKWW